MPPERKGGVLHRGDKFLARVRVSKGRVTPQLIGCLSPTEALRRVEEIQGLVNRFLAAGMPAPTEALARKLAAAASEKERAPLIKVAELALSGRMVSEMKLRSGMSVADFAKLWTTGELHRQHPDHIKLKSSAGKDAGILRRHVLDEIGDIPLVAVDISMIEKVMRGIPPERSSATRRHVAQVLHRIFRLAVFPARLLAVNPIPVGFLPSIRRGRVTAYLYPKDEAALLSCAAVPLERRVLYGFLHREGNRLEEALCLEWTDVDLEVGVLRLDENKTDTPRAWAVDPGTAIALKRWKKIAGKHARVFGQAPIQTRAADQFRADVKAAGIARPELFQRTEKRRPLRLHDARTAFVTIALSIGKSEAWVMDRTGHTSSAILQRYRRGARTAAELGLGSWVPLHEAIPELRGLGSDWDPPVPSGGETYRKPRQKPQNATSERGGKGFKIFGPKGRAGSTPAGATASKTSGSVGGAVRRRSEAGSQSDPKRSGCPLCGGPAHHRIFRIVGRDVIRVAS